MLKFFSFIRIEDLEESVNEWVEKNPQLRVEDITYRPERHENELWHFVMIRYERS